MISRKQYIDKVVDLYCSGKDNAFEVYKRLYTPIKGESDIEFVKRAASLDYDDLSWSGAIYQEVVNSE